MHNNLPWFNNKFWISRTCFWAIYSKTTKVDRIQGCLESSNLLALIGFAWLWKLMRNTIASLLFFFSSSRIHPTQNNDTLQIPIGNSTGSLPDLTLVHYQQSPLSNPLDLENEHIIAVTNGTFNSVRIFFAGSPGYIFTDIRMLSFLHRIHSPRRWR